MEGQQFYGRKTLLELMSKTEIFLFIGSCLSVYLCLLLCGNFGPLPFKVDEQSCGIHNDCSFTKDLNNELQFCQNLTGGDQVIHDDFKVQAHLFIPIEYLRQHQDNMRLNFTAQVVGSYSPKLLETCRDHVISVDAHFQQMRNDYFILKRQVWKEVELDCDEQVHIYNGKEFAYCEPLEIIFVQNLFPYNLIKAEFQGNEDEEDLLKNIYNIEIEYIGRNPYHRKFLAIVGLIFITANIIMIINFYKVYNLISEDDKGHIQSWIAALLLGMIPYNFPYKFFISTQVMLGQFDAFFNTTFICAILMANMVILDSLHTTQGKVWSFYMFYRAKILVIVFVWIMLFGYVFTEHLINFENHLITNNYHPQSIGIQIIRKFYLIAIVIYFVAAVYYIHKAIQKVLAFNTSKFAIFAVVQGVIILFLVIAMLFMPVQNKTLRFMTDNGFINLYMLMISTLLKPVDETYEQAPLNMNQDRVNIEMTDFNIGRQGEDSIDQDEQDEGYTMGNSTSEDRKFFREKNKIEVKDS